MGRGCNRHSRKSACTPRLARGRARALSLSKWPDQMMMVSYRHARTSAGTSRSRFYCARYKPTRSHRRGRLRANSCGVYPEPARAYVCLSGGRRWSERRRRRTWPSCATTSSCRRARSTARRRAILPTRASPRGARRKAALLRSRRLASRRSVQPARRARGTRRPRASQRGAAARDRFRLGSHGAGASDATDVRGGVCLSAEDGARGLLLGGLRLDVARSVSRSTGGRSSGDRRSGEAHHGMLGPSLRTMPELARLASVALPQPIDPRLPDLLRRPGRPLPSGLSDAALAELLSASSRRAAPVPLPS